MHNNEFIKQTFGLESMSDLDNDKLSSLEYLINCYEEDPPLKYSPFEEYEEYLNNILAKEENLFNDVESDITFSGRTNAGISFANIAQMLEQIVSFATTLINEQSEDQNLPERNWKQEGF